MSKDRVRWLLVVGCWLLVIGCWLLVIGCWLLVIGCWAGKPRPYKPIADCRLPKKLMTDN